MLIEVDFVGWVIHPDNKPNFLVNKKKQHPKTPKISPPENNQKPKTNGAKTKNNDQLLSGNYGTPFYTKLLFAFVKNDKNAFFCGNFKIWLETKATCPHSHSFSSNWANL